MGLNKESVSENRRASIIWRDPVYSSTALVIYDCHGLHLIGNIVEGDSKLVREHSVATSSACTDLEAVRKRAIDVQYSVSKSISFSQLHELVSISLVPPKFVRELSILKSLNSVPADNHGSGSLVNKSGNVHLGRLSGHCNCIEVVSWWPFSKANSILSGSFNDNTVSRWESERCDSEGTHGNEAALAVIEAIRCADLVNWNTVASRGSGVAQTESIVGNGWAAILRFSPLYKNRASLDGSSNRQHLLRRWSEFNSQWRGVISISTLVVWTNLECKCICVLVRRGNVEGEACFTNLVYLLVAELAVVAVDCPVYFEQVVVVVDCGGSIHIVPREGNQTVGLVVKLRSSGEVWRCCQNVGAARGNARSTPSKWVVSSGSN